MYGDKPDTHWLLVLLPTKGSKGLVDTAGVGIVMAGCGASRSWRPGQAQLTHKTRLASVKMMKEWNIKTGLKCMWILCRRIGHEYVDVLSGNAMVGWKTNIDQLVLYGPIAGRWKVLHRRGAEPDHGEW